MPDKTLFTRTAPRSGTALVPTLMSAVAVTLTLTLMLSGCGGGGSEARPQHLLRRLPLLHPPPALT